MPSSRPTRTLTSTAWEVANSITSSIRLLRRGATMYYPVATRTDSTSKAICTPLVSRHQSIVITGLMSRSPMCRPPEEAPKWSTPVFDGPMSWCMVATTLSVNRICSICTMPALYLASTKMVRSVQIWFSQVSPAPHVSLMHRLHYGYSDALSSWFIVFLFSRKSLSHDHHDQHICCKKRPLLSCSPRAVYGRRGEREREEKERKKKEGILKQPLFLSPNLYLMMKSAERMMFYNESVEYKNGHVDDHESKWNGQKLWSSQDHHDTWAILMYLPSALSLQVIR